MAGKSSLEDIMWTKKNWRPVNKASESEEKNAHRRHPRNPLKGSPFEEDIVTQFGGFTGYTIDGWFDQKLDGLLD